MTEFKEELKDPYETGILDPELLSNVTSAIDTAVGKFTRKIALMESMLGIQFEEKTYDHISIYCKFQMCGDLKTQDKISTVQDLVIDALLDGKKVSHADLNGGYVKLIQDALGKVIMVNFLSTGGLVVENVMFDKLGWFIVK